MVCAGVAMYPLSLIYLVETQRILTRTSLFLRFTAMVSIGLTDAHVQPVLEKIPATSF
jgi:hypothetical protein